MDKVDKLLKMAHEYEKADYGVHIVDAVTNDCSKCGGPCRAINAYGGVIILDDIPKNPQAGWHEALETRSRMGQGEECNGEKMPWLSSLTSVEKESVLGHCWEKTSASAEKVKQIPMKKRKYRDLFGYG